MNSNLKILLTLILIIVLLCMGAFFSATETAYTSLSRITIRQMLKSNARNSKKIAFLKSNLDKLITTVLVGNNFVNTLNSSVATAFALEVFGPEYLSAATAVITVLVIVFSEIIPKTYAGIKSQSMAQFAATPVIWIQRIFFPVIWIFSVFTNFIDFLEHKIIKTKRPLITEDELKTLIDVGEHEGTLEQDERKMLDRIFEFSDLNLHDIMRHRSLVRYVNVNETLDNVIKLFVESGYSRLPVYEDNPENIIGVLHYKGVLFASKPITSSRDFIRICMRPVMFVPETMSAIDLLHGFKKEKNNFAVVVNEYGSMAGIVTMDDILHEVFGRMTDEYGYAEVAPEKRVTVLGTNEFLVPGDMKLDDLNDVLNLNLSSENFDTLGGWLLERFDELPPIGAVYKCDGNIYIVEDQSSRRIQTVRIKL